MMFHIRSISHASDEQLLMELDGELSSGEANSVRAHLDACWRCRARKQELERSIADFIQVHQREFDRRLPPAAGPRAMLKARLAQYAEAERNQPTRWFPNWQTLVWAAALCLFAFPIAGWIAPRFKSHQRDAMTISTPDTALTPGAALLLSRSAVCSQANVKNKPVPASVQRLVFAEYGLAKAQPRGYEVDYLVTPALGGSDDIRNLWPHSYSSLWNARVKDALEDRLRDMVCEGSLDLADAQREIAGNWIETYKKYFHTDHPLPEHTKR